MSGNSRSRSFSLSFLESSKAARLSSRLGPSTHAATTSGPAHAPRPTSSTPATGPSPPRYSADSRVRRPADLRITERSGQAGGNSRPPSDRPHHEVDQQERTTDDAHRNEDDV